MERVFLMTDGGPGGSTEIVGTYIYRATRSAGSNIGTCLCSGSNYFDCCICDFIYSIENDSKEWAGVRDEKKKRKRIRTRFIFDFKSKQKSNGGLSHHYAGIVVYTDLFFIKRFLESTWY